MAVLLQLLEYCLGCLLHYRRAYDHLLFHKSAGFHKHPTPTISITSPDCGPTGTVLAREYSKFGSSRFPQLSWSADTVPPLTKEFLLLCEDPDAPFGGEPNVHGIYCFIPAHVTTFGPKDLELIGEVDGVKSIAGGYRVGKNRRNAVYVPPRPPLGHGPHRYLFELVALSEKLDPESVTRIPNKKEIEKAIMGKVVGWGLWQATYENTWSWNRLKTE